jgi:hypothetical protein
MKGASPHARVRNGPGNRGGPRERPPRNRGDGSPARGCRLFGVPSTVALVQEGRVLFQTFGYQFALVFGFWFL